MSNKVWNMSIPWLSKSEGTLCFWALVIPPNENVLKIIFSWYITIYKLQLQNTKPWKKLGNTYQLLPQTGVFDFVGCREVHVMEVFFGKFLMMLFLVTKWCRLSACVLQALICCTPIFPSRVAGMFLMLSCLIYRYHSSSHIPWSHQREELCGSSLW